MPLPLVRCRAATCVDVKAQLAPELLELQRGVSREATNVLTGARGQDVDPVPPGDTAPLVSSKAPLVMQTPLGAVSRKGGDTPEPHAAGCSWSMPMCH